MFLIRVSSKGNATLASLIWPKSARMFFQWNGVSVAIYSVITLIEKKNTPATSVLFDMSWLTFAQNKTSWLDP